MSSFEDWWLWLNRLLIGRGISLSEAKRRIDEAPPFEPADLFRVIQELLGESRMDMEHRYQLASLLLAAIDGIDVERTVVRGAHQLFVLAAIDLLLERHDGAVFEQAAASVAELVDHATSEDEFQVRMLAGRLYLEPFAPDPAYDHYPVVQALRKVRQEWAGGFLSEDDRLPARMPDREQCLEIAAGHFTAAADCAEGWMRGVALAHLAFGSFTSGLARGDVSDPMFRHQVREAARLLPEADEPLSGSRIGWMLDLDPGTAGPRYPAVVGPMAISIGLYGVHGAIATHVVGLRRTLAGVGAAERRRLIEGLLSWLPHVGLEGTRLWLRLQLGQCLPEDPQEAAEAFRLVQAVAARDAAAEHFGKARLDAVEAYATAITHFAELGYHEHARFYLGGMADQLRSEEPAAVGRWLDGRLADIERLTDVAMTSLAEASSMTLQACLASLIRGALARTGDFSPEHLLVLSQQAKGRSFGAAACAPTPLVPTTEEAVWLDMATQEEAVMVDDPAAGTLSEQVDDVILDEFAVGIGSFVSRTEMAPGHTAAEVVRNLRLRYEQAAAKALAQADHHKPFTLGLDEVRARLSYDALVLSLYYGDLGHELGHGMVAQALGHDLAVVHGLAMGEWMDRAIMLVGDSNEVGVGRWELSTFSHRVGLLWRELQEDPLHRLIARSAQTRLDELAGDFEPLLSWFDRQAVQREFTHLYIWPHRATYFLPIWLFPFREGVLADVLTVTYLPSLGHLPMRPRRTSTLRARIRRRPARTWLLAVGCADGGGRHGLRSEPSLESTADLIGELFGCRALTGSDATPTAVLDGMRDATLVHIGGHGGRDLVAPAFHNVLLHAGYDGEGRLFAHQIRAIDLSHVRLVTLSACESSMIRYDHNDNLTGLPAAFLLAGAAAVVGALWPVTAPVADTFYRTVYARLAAGVPTAVAFRTAQQTTRTEFPQYRDWGAFCFLGRAEQEGRVGR